MSGKKIIIILVCPALRAHDLIILASSLNSSLRVPATTSPIPARPPPHFLTGYCVFAPFISHLAPPLPPNLITAIPSSHSQFHTFTVNTVPSLSTPPIPPHSLRFITCPLIFMMTTEFVLLHTMN